MKKDIVQKWFFRQSASEVWEYLTKPELIAQWLTQTDFEPVLGHKFQFTDKSGKIIHCEVLEVQPFSRLEYSWQYFSAIDNKILNSKVVWTLTPTENGTELQLVHDGFTFAEDYVAHNNGWNTCLKRFEKLINVNHS